MSERRAGYASNLSNLDLVLRAMPERDWQRHVVTVAERNGWRVWHDRATNMRRTCVNCRAPIRQPRNDPGFPDLVLVRAGRIIFAELKAEDGRVEPEQRAWLDAFMSVPAIGVYVWRPGDHKMVEEILR